MEALIVPSSIQRVRSFLIEMCGMKVKPWASTEETLGALHTMLVARQQCDIFWTSLRVLLEKLASDLKARQGATPGSLLDNELLDGERYASLLDEIRAALARQTAEPSISNFRRLASSLSAPALGLLLFLGGAATVGCDHSSLSNPSQTQDASAPGAPDTKTDGSIYITLPDVGPAPDTFPSKPDATSGLDGATVTIQDIMDSCNVPTQQQAYVLACLAQLRESWTTGMASVLATENCTSVNNDLSCFTYSYSCMSPPPTAEFDPANMPICQPIIIYLGVRFV